MSHSPTKSSIASGGKDVRIKFFEVLVIDKEKFFCLVDITVYTKQ
jgi:hypothetical protein